MAKAPESLWSFDAAEIMRGVVPRADAHMHTTWTDGADGIGAMHQAAIEHGLETIVFSEHARKSSGDWFADFAAEVRALPANECHALVGVEVKVEDLDGALDVTDEIARACDVVMASVHRFPGERGVIRGTTGGYAPDVAVELEYRLSCAALDNPATDLLGHPFGMSYRRFQIEPAEHLVRDLVARAAAADVAFEINSRYHPDPRRLLAWCAEAGGRVALGSNAHDRAEVGRIVRVLTEAGET